MEKSKSCQICFSTALYKFLDLGSQTPVVFLTHNQLNDQEKSYPLDVYYCQSCGLVQLGHVVNPEILFTNEYHHIAALSASFKSHLNMLASSLTRRFSLNETDLVVDIGANDGSLLEEFIPHKIKILGVDPSDVAKIASDKGIPIINKFFNEKVAHEIIETSGNAKIILSLNTFAHVAPLHPFMNGVKLLLDDSGIFVTESHYLLDLISELQYDAIYHEHLRYYSVKSLTFLFNLFGMDVFDVERKSTHAGSIRVYACKKGAYPISNAVGDLCKLEDESGLSTLDTYVNFEKRVKQHRSELLNLLRTLKVQQKRIVGITFPARALTLLNYCQIDSDTLEYLTEQSPLKIGKFTPLSHIKIVREPYLFEDQPDFGLLLSWHITDEITKKFKERGFKGNFIIPFPKPTII